MCLAIAKPAGIELPVEAMHDGFNENPDGAGYAVVAPGHGLLVRKGFFSFNHFIKDFHKNVGVDHPAIVHFRWATHGTINRKNCHPFLVGPSMAVVHNGVLPWRSTKKRSDTSHFASEVLTPTRLFVGHPEHKEEIERFIGPSNKLAFLDAKGKLTIYNEGSGEWRRGIWYSRADCGLTPEDFQLQHEQEQEEDLRHWSKWYADLDDNLGNAPEDDGREFRDQWPKRKWESYDEDDGYPYKHFSRESAWSR